MSQLAVPFGIIGLPFRGAVCAPPSRGTDTPMVIRFSSCQAPMTATGLPFQDTECGPPFQGTAKPIVRRARRSNNADDTAGRPFRGAVYGPPFRGITTTVCCTAQRHIQLVDPFGEPCSIDPFQGSSRKRGVSFRVARGVDPFGRAASTLFRGARGRGASRSRCRAVSPLSGVLLGARQSVRRLGGGGGTAAGKLRH